MSIIKYLFADSSLKKYYLEIKELKNIREEFEHYLFSVYEKTNIIAEIKNKFYDIKNRNRGFIREDERIFEKTKAIGVNRNYRKDRSILYFKGWTNRRLKRIRKIINLEIKSRFGIIKGERNIIVCLRDLRRYFEGLEAKKDKESLNNLLILLRELESNIVLQKKEIDRIYPIKSWTLDLHENIISDKLLKLIYQEIKLLFKRDINPWNYNVFPAVISESINEHKIPENTILMQLINEKIAKVREKRKQINNLKMIECYHGKPSYIHDNVFPLDIKKKSTGFFIDTDLQETINVVKSLYGLREIIDQKIDIFKLKIPLELFKYAIPDTFDERMLEKVESMDHSYIIRPSYFPIFNEFFRKGFIKIKKM